MNDSPNDSPTAQTANASVPLSPAGQRLHSHLQPRQYFALRGQKRPEPNLLKF